MLKWLVTKGPSSSVPLEKVTTDDPLATISRKHKKHNPIYAVSRVNPIFEEEDVKESEPASLLDKEVVSKTQEEHPESPPTDRESVRSSGYGSKEADSVSFKSDSQEDEEDHIFKESDPSTIPEQENYRRRQKTDDKQLESTVNKPDTKQETSLNFGSPGTVAELRKSFETISSQDKIQPKQVEIFERNKNFVSSIAIGSQRPPLSNLEVIPEASESAENSPSKSPWPRVSHLAQALQRQADRIHKRREREKHLQALQDDCTKSQILRFNPLVNIVDQNMQYVTAISVSPKRKVVDEQYQDYSNPFDNGSNFLLEPKFSLSVNKEKPVPAYFRQSKSISNGEFPLLSLQPDSLITEDTLHMMNYPETTMKSNEAPLMSNRMNPNDMPDFGRALYSSFYSNNRSRSNSSNSSQKSFGRYDRNLVTNSSNSNKKKGLNVVKDLWEKSGLKTNGRKLLVDVNDLISEDNDHLSVSRKSSYGSNEDYRSFHSTLGSKGSGYRHLTNGTSSSSARSSNTYDYISRNLLSSSSGTYEEVFDGGIDNLAFQEDRRLAKDTTSIHSKSSFQFQHNLTDFQRRVSEKLQGESSHNKHFLDVEKGLSVSNNSSIDGSLEEVSYNTNGGGLSRIKDKIGTKNKNLPGKAVREFGLEDQSYRKNHWSGSNENNKPTKNQQYLSAFGFSNQKLLSGSFNLNYPDRSLSGIFSLHPNSEALNCKSGGHCQDFTIDPRKSQRNQLKYSKSKRRKRCCAVLLVIFALAFFIGTIVGVSWYYTGGQRIFGPM